MSIKRTKLDPFAAAGIGFPLVVALSIVGAFAAAATNRDAIVFPAEMAGTTSGGSINSGAAVAFTQAQFHAQTPGDRTTGTYTFTLTKIDSAGNSLGAWATFTVAAAAPLTLVDLRDSAGNGLTLLPGEGLRLDTGAAATGGATSAADIRIRLIGESYGIAA